MTKAKQITLPYQEVLSDLLAWFKSTPVKGLIIGGVAFAILGKPRFTKDVDAMVLYPTVEDFVIMKAVAHRPQDLVDIGTVLSIHSKIDVKRIRKWVKEFTKVLEMPEIYDDLAKLLKK